MNYEVDDAKSYMKPTTKIQAEQDLKTAIMIKSYMVL